MYCALSGEVPEQPAVNKKTGQVFEKRLLQKHIENGGKCPMTNEPIEEDDIIELKGNKVVKPRPVEASSIPGMVGLFQSEWDALMLETYQLKQHLDQTRQELSHALYQHDAACRVIARLQRERDHARAALAQAQQLAASGGGAAAPEAVAMDEDDSGELGLSEAVCDEMQATAKVLSKGRKRRAIPEGVASKTQISSYQAVGSHTIHDPSKPPVLAVDMAAKQPNVTLTGGADKKARLFDLTAGKVLATLEGHTKKVTDVIVHPAEDMLFTASADKTVRIWTPAEEGAYQAAHVIAGHSGDVNSISLQPTGKFIASGGADANWCFIDAVRGAVLKTFSDAAIQHAYNSIEFHPDGMLLGSGSDDSILRIWDVRGQKVAANCAGHEGPVTSLSFSQNGYTLASGSADGTVKLWDLRKLVEVKSFDFGSPVQAVTIDHSGQYLAAAGADVRVLAVKEWSVLATLDAHTSTVNDLVFDPLAKSLVTVSSDRAIKVFEPAAEE